MILMVVSMVKNSELFNLDGSILVDLFNKCIYPQEILPIIDDYILEFGKRLSLDEYDKVTENIWIHKSAKIGDGVEIIGPAIIMESLRCLAKPFKFRGSFVSASA